MRFFDYLKNFFFILILIQIVPIFIEGIKKQYSSYLEPKTKIGLITFKGMLSDASPYITSLNTLFKDRTIKGILIKMDCHGSASGTGQTIHNELKALKAAYPKPVGVIVENMCASGGYYIASTADYIIAPGMALIGSIGICMPYFFQLRELLETYKIKSIPLKAGAYKNATDPFVDITDKDKALLQGFLDNSYQQFIEDVAENRHLALAQAPVWADGKIFSGKQAVELGLIDGIGSMYHAINIMKKRALIDGEIEFIQEPRQSGFFSWLAPSSDRTPETSITHALFDSFYSYIQQKSMICT